MSDLQQDLFHTPAEPTAEPPAGEPPVAPQAAVPAADPAPANPAPADPAYTPSGAANPAPNPAPTAPPPVPPYAPNPAPPYNQPLYGQPPAPPYGQPPYGQPPYGQGAVPIYSPVPQKKKMSAGKIIGIVLGCIFGLFLLFVVLGVVTFFTYTSPDKYLEAYQQSGELADLIDACDRYDTQIAAIREPIAAELCFAEALADTKAFHRAFPDAECAAYFDDDPDFCYNIFMADYLYLMLINGNYEHYTQVFTQKMLECSASGNYYMDSYTFVGYVEDGVFTLTDAQKQVVYQGFDMLIAASTTEEEEYLNWQEYYDCCEAFGDYDKADEIEQILNGAAIA